MQPQDHNMDNTLNDQIMSKLSGLNANYTSFPSAGSYNDNVANAYSAYQASLGATPQKQAEFQKYYVAEDQPLNTLMQGYSDKVMELYNYDRSAANAYNAPIQTGGQTFVADPMIAATAGREKFQQINKEKEAAWLAYEKRKNMLGDVVEKALKAYEAKVSGDKAAYEAAKDERDYALKAFETEETLALKEREMRLKELETKNIKTGVATVDAMDNDTVLMEFTKKFGPSAFGNLKGDTDAKITQARAILAQGTMGETPLYMNTAAEQASMGGIVAGYKLAEKIMTKFKGEPSILGGLVSPKTGPWINKIFGTGGPGGTLRRDLAILSRDKIKDTFGGALTEGEISRLQGWATEPGMQEQQVYRNIEGLLNEARMIYEQRLINAGYPPEYVKLKMNQMFTPVSKEGEIPDEAIEEGF